MTTQVCNSFSHSPSSKDAAALSLDDSIIYSLKSLIKRGMCKLCRALCRGVSNFWFSLHLHLTGGQQGRRKYNLYRAFVIIV